MTKERWARIKTLPANTSRIFHNSSHFAWHYGWTYDIGRNKAKRELKALRASWVRSA